MKRFQWRALLVSAIVALLGVCEIQADVLLPFGQISKEAWSAKYYYALNTDAGPDEDWYAVDFDDSAWDSIYGPISNSSSYFHATAWAANGATYWTRRHFTIEELDSIDLCYLHFIHDDVCKAYLNGYLIYENTSVVSSYNTITLDDETKAYLREGDNVLAVYVTDTGAGESYMDYGLHACVAEGLVYGSSDVELTMVNDTLHPWKPDPANLCYTNGNKGKAYSTSSISFSYKSDYQTEVSLNWACYNYSHHIGLKLYVDGELRTTTANSSYTTPRLYLSAGEHVITICDTIGNSTSTNNWSRIKNLRVREILALESAVLTERSENLTFQNDETYPWTIENGYIQSSNYGTKYSASKFSTTFTVVDDIAVFSYYPKACQLNGGSGNQSYHLLTCYINGEKYMDTYNRTAFDARRCVALEPGTYTIEFVDTIYNSTTAYVSQIKDMELLTDWLEIDMPSAGTLGVEVLYSVDVLTDVEMLRVKGTLNSTDWTNIKQMKNLIALDLSEAKFDVVPDYAFDGLSYLSSVKLPEGMTAINQYAFRGTQIWKIDIPSTVTQIGQYAFASTRLEEINFPENSQLKRIDYHAFAYCTSLKEFIMPNTVTSMDTYVFSECSVLETVHFSDALTSIPDYTCYFCYKLSNIHLPVGLVSIGRYAIYNADGLEKIDFPETLTSIGEYAFSGCQVLKRVNLPAKLTNLGYKAFSVCAALKYIELPSYINEYDRTLADCHNIDTIVCNAPTPPAVYRDILYSGRAKSEVNLVVPSFAVVNYKLDTYWYQFGNIVASEEVEDYWKIVGDLALTNNRRMAGKPDIDLYYNGRLMVGGDASFEAGTMNFFVSESQPCRLLNNCPVVNVDSVNTYYSVSANTWYFFTPLHDVQLNQVAMSNDASYVFRYYNGATRASSGTGSSWQNVPAESTLWAGQGYIFRCSKACVVTMPAAKSVHTQLFECAEKNIALLAHETEVEANKNWNYVGNPYPCYYDIWYMDFTAPITVWTGSTYAAYSITDDDFVLRPMQSFFVQKPDGEDDIVFKPEGRQLTATVAHASYAARSNTPRFVFNLEIGTDSVCDRTRVVFNDDKSLDYELECDASKFMSMDASVPQIYTVDKNLNRLAINERPVVNGRVALGVYVGQTGIYKLTASRADGTVMLYDALTDTYTDLSNGEYTFHVDEVGFIEGRFELTLTVQGGATSVEETDMEIPVKVVAEKGCIRVEGVENLPVQLYSMEGKLLKSAIGVEGSLQFTVPAGAYVIVVKGKSYKAIVY